MDIKEKISKVMKQAVDHCEVMGVNLLVEKEEKSSSIVRREWLTGKSQINFQRYHTSVSILRQSR